MPVILDNKSPSLPSMRLWLLLLGSAAAAFYSWRRDSAQRSIRHVGIGALRVIVGCMWWQQSLWKIPPHYDWGLIHWMEEMVKHASTQLQSDLVRDLVLPNIAIFGLEADVSGAGYRSWHHCV